MNGRLKKISSASKSATPCFSQFLPLLPSSHSNPVHSIQAFMCITIIHSTARPDQAKTGAENGRRPSLGMFMRRCCRGHRGGNPSELMVVFMAVDKGRAIDDKTRRPAAVQISSLSHARRHPINRDKPAKTARSLLGYVSGLNIRNSDILTSEVLWRQ